MNESSHFDAHTSLSADHWFANQRGLSTLSEGILPRDPCYRLGATEFSVPRDRYAGPGGFRKVRNLVELGSGTGVITQEILRRMTPDSRLFALEINRNFVRHLRTCCQDIRLTVLQVDASDLLN